MNKRTTISEFIDKSIKVHGNRYSYEKSIYINTHTKLIIICPQHGEFLQIPKEHIKGAGCKKCYSDLQRTNILDFIEKSNKIHNNKFNYEKVSYNKLRNKIIIICPEHGEFEQFASNHLLGKGCRKCAYTELLKTTKYFIDKSKLLHSHKYNYNEVIYKNAITKVKIICPKHGYFLQKPYSHLEGRGCPTCGDRFGIKENKWLDSLNIKEKQYRIGKYIVDGYDPDTNTIYEFNGDYWHGNPKLYSENDVNNVLNKTFGELYRKTKDREEYLIKKGYNVISIWESDFNKQSY